METQTNVPLQEGLPPSAPGAAPAPVDSPQPKSSNIVMLVVVGLVTAVVAGGLVFWLQGSKIKSVETAAQNNLSALQAQLVSSQNEMLSAEENFNAEKATMEEELADTENMLLVSKFMYKILDLWSVKNVVQDSVNRNNFYYSNNFSGSSNIGRYNLSADLSYAADQTFDIPSSNAIVYSEELGENMAFELLETDGSTILFYEKDTTAEYDKCFSPWIQAKLFSLDLSNPSAVKAEFKMPLEMQTEKQAEVSQCLGTEAPEEGTAMLDDVMVDDTDEGVMVEGDVMTDDEAMTEGDAMVEDGTMMEGDAMMEEDNS